MKVKLAPHQTRAWEDPARFQVRVWARRSGKTFFTLLRKLARIQQEGKGDWQAFYLAPTRIQAAQIALPYLMQFAAPLGATLNKSELKVTIPGKGFIQLSNALEYDRLRGLYMDDVTLDEAADIPEAAWTEVISPAISDRKGRLNVMGTPRGRLNLLWKMWEKAGDDPDWSRSLLTWEDAGMVSPDEIERNRRQQSEAVFNQEWMCSWSGATPGAYWGREMSDAEAQGRVTAVKYDSALPVVAALDLGHHDLMPVIFGQEYGTEHRIIHCKAYQFTSIPDMVADWKRTLPFFPDRVILPHDANVTELGSGRTRTEVFTSLGCSVTIAPKLSLDEGIEQTRLFLKHAHFDREDTLHLREGLAQYRSDYDELRGVYRLKPIHDIASHYADAMRYYAIGDRSALGGWGQKPKLGANIYA